MDSEIKPLFIQLHEQSKIQLHFVTLFQVPESHKPLFTSWAIWIVSPREVICAALGN